MKHYKSIVLLACVFPSCAHAQGNDAREILSKVGAVYRGLSTVQISGVRTTEQHDAWHDSVNRTPFTLIAEQHNKFRSESSTKAGTDLQVSDGKFFWYYLAQSNQYMASEHGASPPYLNEYQLNLKDPLTNLNEARLLREEVLEGGGAKHTCDVIEASYETEGSSKMEMGPVTLWVDHESRLVWKVRANVVHDGGSLAAS